MERTTGQTDKENKLIQRLCSLNLVDTTVKPPRPTVNYIIIPTPFLSNVHEVSRIILKEFKEDVFEVKSPPGGRVWIYIKRNKKIELLYEGIIYISISVLLLAFYITYFDHIRLALLLLTVK